MEGLLREGAGAEQPPPEVERRRAPPCDAPSMSQGSVPLLYRHILRAAKRFPSVKREGILREIKTEFHANKAPAQIPSCNSLKPEACRPLAAACCVAWRCMLRGCPFCARPV